MSIRKILAVTVCALLLAAATVSAQEKTETNPWTASLQATTLEGFGTCLTIELPPLEYCQLGRFSTKSEGNDFGFVGNTFSSGDARDALYIGISCEENSAFSKDGDTINQLSDYAHNFISTIPASNSAPPHHP